MTTKTTTQSHSATDGEKYNIFRDSLLRYAGYANEVGESFRYQFPKFVVPSYAVSFSYCCADAASTGYEVWQKDLPDDQRLHDTVRATADTLLWQSLASVAIPGAAINLIVKASRRAVARSPVALPVMAAKWLPTAVGLGSIPVIIKPIDLSVDFLLDNSIRHVWKAYSS